METTNYGALASSANPQELSTTVQSIARMLAGLLVFSGFLTVADSTTLLSHVSSIITDITVLVPLAYAMWNSGEIIFGIFRKGIVAWAKAKKTAPIIQAQEPNLG